MYADDVAALCRAICEETESFFEELRNRPGVAGSVLSEIIDRWGYSVFFGPPPVQPPPILFVGYQPGGETGGEKAAPGAECWPSVNQYTDASEDYPLARELQAVFPEETHPGFLRSCFGTNAIYLRAPGVTTYKNQVPAKLRGEINRFCIERTRRVIKGLQPGVVVAIGVTTLELFETTPTESESKPTKGRLVRLRSNNHWLIGRGSIMGQETHSVLHLTGSRPRPSPEERQAIAAYLRSLATSLPRRP